MSRLARKDLNTSFFHVMSQGINKEKIFKKNSFKIKYRSILTKNELLTDVQIIAYCIMDNHVHLLIYSENIDNLSLFMKNVNTEYAQYYNWKYNRVGYVFRDRFKSQPIYNKEYLYKCINYIHLNPVKAGYVKGCNDYAFSSYGEYQKNIGVTKNKIFGELFFKNNFFVLDKIEQCSDFIDEDYDKDAVIDEYINNYLNKNNRNYDEIYHDETIRKDVIQILLKSKLLKKKDIQEKLNITWKILNRYIVE